MYNTLLIEKSFTRMCLIKNWWVSYA